VFFGLPDTPMQARYLSDQEKVALLEHIKVNQTGVEGKHFIPAQLIEALLDVQLWIFFFSFLLGGTGGGVITTYSSTILKNLGYTPKRSALLLMATGPMTIVGALFVGYGVRYYGNRWLFIAIVLILSVLGSALLAFPPGNKKASAFVGILFADLLVAQTSTIYQWLGANLAGHTKRAYGAAMLQVAFAIGSIIGPQTFQARDQPDYQPAKISLMSFLAVECVGILSLRVYYGKCNKSRDKRSQAAGEDVADTTAYAGLTDKQNVTFRYVY
jgi:predicted MFS family arabinose efflux permease